MNTHVGLFIDGENIGREGVEFASKKVVEFGQNYVRRIYGNLFSGKMKGFEEIIRINGLEPIATQIGSSWKNASDIRMAIDIMEFQYESNIDIYAIASSDSDFIAVATWLRKKGKKVILIGDEEKVSNGVKMHYDNFFPFKSESSKEINTENPKPIEPSKPVKVIKFGRLYKRNNNFVLIGENGEPYDFDCEIKSDYETLDLENNVVFWVVENKIISIKLYGKIVSKEFQEYGFIEYRENGGQAFIIPEDYIGFKCGDKVSFDVFPPYRGKSVIAGNIEKITSETEKN